MFTDVLSRIAGQILALNEEDLLALLPKYRKIMEGSNGTKEWEESVIIYFLINSVRVKNSLINKKIKGELEPKENKENLQKTTKLKINRLKPKLRLIKSKKTDEE